MLSVIIPANNEAAYIGQTLTALLASRLPRGETTAAGDRRAEPSEAPSAAAVNDAGPLEPVAQGTPACDARRQEAALREIIIAANGCTDDTIGVARGFEAEAARHGWHLTVLDIPEGGKLNALNVADGVATGDIRIYLDADIIVSPELIAELQAALDRAEPAYGSGRLTVAPAQSWITRAYARIWQRTPFMTTGVQGGGVFAVNAAGRRRWGRFPAIIADDTYVRLLFAPDERLGVPASYLFPLPEGLERLVRVRGRQDRGVREVATLFPDLVDNDDKPRFGLRRAVTMALSDPVGFGVYGLVAVAARFRARRHAGAWERGR